MEEDEFLNVSPAVYELSHKEIPPAAEEEEIRGPVYRKSLRLICRWVETGYMFKENNCTAKLSSDSGYQDKLLGSSSANSISSNSESQDLDLVKRPRMVVCSSTDSAIQEPKKSQSKNVPHRYDKIKLEIIKTNIEKTDLVNSEPVPKSDTSSNDTMIFVNRSRIRKKILGKSEIKSKVNKNVKKLDISDSEISDLIYDKTYKCNSSKVKSHRKKKKKLFDGTEDVNFSPISEGNFSFEERKNFLLPMIDHPALASAHKRHHSTDQTFLNTPDLSSGNITDIRFAIGAVRVSQNTKDFLKKSCSRAKNFIDKEIRQLTQKKHENFYPRN